MNFCREWHKSGVVSSLHHSKGLMMLMCLITGNAYPDHSVKLAPVRVFTVKLFLSFCCWQVSWARHIDMQVLYSPNSHPPFYCGVCLLVILDSRFFPSFLWVITCNSAVRKNWYLFIYIYHHLSIYYLSVICLFIDLSIYIWFYYISKTHGYLCSTVGWNLILPLFILEMQQSLHCCPVLGRTWKKTTGGSG